MSTFEDALAYFEYHLAEAEKVGIEADICLAPIDNVYELLGNFFEGDNGDIVGLENEYVSEDVAMRLAIEFNVPIMIVAETQEELDEIYGVPT
jgi:hypothetical protein